MYVSNSPVELNQLIGLVKENDAAREQLKLDISSLRKQLADTDYELVVNYKS